MSVDPHVFRTTNTQGKLCLLGEQLERPRLQEVLDRWQIEGPVGLVAAGWEEDEDDDGWVRDAIRNPVINSNLYQLADELFSEDPEILTLLRRRQDQLRVLREVNQLQTDHLCNVARELLKASTRTPFQTTALDQTFAQLRDVDDTYLVAVTATIDEYDQRIAPKSRATVLRYRERVLERLNGCQALLLAGGHVGVLLNRLKLSRLLSGMHLPLIAWSGGAMAMGDRLYFYHQYIPHATGEIELSRYGMRWLQGIQLFPRAANRLRLQDPIELEILARRIPATCLAMDMDSELAWDGPALTRCHGVQVVTQNGSLERWTP